MTKLEVKARDGAGRLAEFPLGERAFAVPNILWLADRLPAGETHWWPTLGRAGQETAVVATRRFTEEAPAPRPGQLLLTRSLQPAASMLQAPLLERAGEAICVWGQAADLARDPKRFSQALVEARTQAGSHHALYAPGLGQPHALALLVYAGIDLLDATTLHYAAARGHYLTDAGSFDASALTETECACPACRQEAPQAFTEAELATHNQYAARAELGRVRNALRAGRLRELVEGRVRADPELTALLRRLDAAFEYFEARTPLQRSTTLWANTKESLARAEFRRFRERLKTRYRPPPSPPVLLLLPCSARKPYATSRTHRAFADAIWAAGAAGLVHEVIVTSPLGLVPRELEMTFPAAHYDVPVTGEWDEEEGTMIRDLLANLFSKRTYARIVSHLPRHTYNLVRSLLPSDHLVTCEGENATDGGALKRLELTLAKLTQEHRPIPLPRLVAERVRAVADYQFGPDAADLLCRNTEVSGRWPHPKLMAAGVQLGMLPPTRGLLSLTLAGARRLLDSGRYGVEIEDFPLRGGVFAVGVRAADPQIRVGDEVVVHHANELRGAGVARMAGWEMTQLRRGEAVEVRHHV